MTMVMLMIIVLLMSMSMPVDGADDAEHGAGGDVEDDVRSDYDDINDNDENNSISNTFNL